MTNPFGKDTYLTTERDLILNEGRIKIEWLLSYLAQPHSDYEKAYAIGSAVEGIANIALYHHVPTLEEQLLGLSGRNEEQISAWGKAASILNIRTNVNTTPEEAHHLVINRLQTLQPIVEPWIALQNYMHTIGCTVNQPDLLVSTVLDKLRQIRQLNGNLIARQGEILDLQRQLNEFRDAGVKWGEEKGALVLELEKAIAAKDMHWLAYVGAEACMRSSHERERIIEEHRQDTWKQVYALRKTVGSTWQVLHDRIVLLKTGDKIKKGDLVWSSVTREWSNVDANTIGERIQAYYAPHSRPLEPYLLGMDQYAPISDTAEEAVVVEADVPEFPPPGPITSAIKDFAAPEAPDNTAKLSDSEILIQRINTAAREYARGNFASAPTAGEILMITNAMLLASEITLEREREKLRTDAQPRAI